MATTFSVLGSGLGSFRAAPAETLLYQKMHDGTTSGLILTGCSATTSISDPDGGTNAVRFTSGVSATLNASIDGANNAFTFNPSVNNIRFYVRKGSSWASAQAWVRVRTINMDAGISVNRSIRIDAGTGTTGETGFTVVEVTDVGGGWWRVHLTLDCTSATDRSGQLRFFFADASGDATINSNNDHILELYNLRVTY